MKQPKPWQSGFIPPSAKRTAPEINKGRHVSGFELMFRDGKAHYYLNTPARLFIVGSLFIGWEVRRTDTGSWNPYIEKIESDTLLMRFSNLDAAVVYTRLEAENFVPEPQPDRNAWKARTFGARFGSGVGKLSQYAAQSMQSNIDAVALRAAFAAGAKGMSFIMDELVIDVDGKDAAAVGTAMHWKTIAKRTCWLLWTSRT